MSKGGEELTSEEKHKYATPKLSRQGKYLMHILKSNLMQNKSWCTKYQILDSGRISNYNLIKPFWAWGKWNIQWYCIKIFTSITEYFGFYLKFCAQGKWLTLLILVLLDLNFCTPDKFWVSRHEVVKLFFYLLSQNFAFDYLSPLATIGKVVEY